jgi:3-hydroxyacyl-CoA dehydrogenase
MTENVPAFQPGDVGAYVARAEFLAWTTPDVSPETPLLPIRTVGIVGAGTMGGGIAMNFASAGVPVTIVETRQGALDRGLALVRRNYENSAKRGRFSMQDAEERIARIRGTLDVNDLAESDLVIEAVFEDMPLKKDIFSRLDGVVKEGAILATNTSGLDIDEIAAVTTRPEWVIGLHFFSPANVMKLVEVVRAAKTSNSVIATSMDMAKRIGKLAVLVGVCPGFVGNRMLYPRQLQAQALLRQGLMPWDIDEALNAFGFKMGPFQMADLAGLDIGWSKGQTKGDPIRNALCEMDRRGQKTGAGYYDYDAERRPHPSAVVEKVIADHASPGSQAKPRRSQQEIIETLIFPMINEGAKILEEKKAQRASDIDMVWLYGYGWPRDKGGPMYYADHVGLEKVLEKAAQLGAASDYFKPAQLLERLAASDGHFTSN